MRGCRSNCSLIAKFLAGLSEPPIRSVLFGRKTAFAEWATLFGGCCRCADTGFKPSKYTSFNTRYDKLNVKISACYQAYRHSRCVIPAKGFGETEYVNNKLLHYHDLIAKDGAILLGSLCREWLNKDTGESALSCSVITLPPLPKLKKYIQKHLRYCCQET